jgi:hypothetical protein
MKLTSEASEVRQSSPRETQMNPQARRQLRYARLLANFLIWMPSIYLGFSLLGFVFGWFSYGERTAMGRFVRSELSLVLLCVIACGSIALTLGSWQTPLRLIVFGFLCFVGYFVDAWYFASGFGMGLSMLAMAAIIKSQFIRLKMSGAK